MENTRPSKWETNIPWFLTTASIVALAVIGCFLVYNIEWFKNSVFSHSIAQRDTPEYRFYAYHMHLSMIKRCIGLFSGFAVMFLGTSVMFYTIKSNITSQIGSPTFSASLATASPGIVALVVGCYIIVETIKSKDDFPFFNRNNTEQQVTILPPPK